MSYFSNLFEQIAFLIESFCCISIQKFQEITLSAILFYSKIHTKVSTAIRQLSNNYIVVKNLCDACIYVNTKIKFKLHKLFANHRLEPEYSPWINATWLNDDNDIVEEYFDFSKDENICKEYMNSYFETTIALAMQTPNTGILIMRYENDTRCNIIEQKEPRDVYDYSTSNVKFIAIEYKHQLMKEAILIQLDRSWFICGNQLLSDVFVRRYLDYQRDPFYYDETYTITLIDNDMNIITLDNTQYVLLEKDTYRIVKREFDQPIDTNDRSDTESFESASSNKIDSDDNSE